MKTPVSATLAARMGDLDISVEQLSVAAGVHKTTLYRILDGTTSSPRPGTLRRLARALQVPLVELTDQIEPPALKEHLQAGHPLETILIEQFRLLGGDLRVAGCQAAVSAMLDVEAGLGVRRNLPAHSDRVIKARGRAPQAVTLEKLLRRLFRRLPRLLQRTAVREAVRAMIDLQLRLGTPPSHALYQVARYRQLQPTPPGFWAREREAKIRVRRIALRGLLQSMNALLNARKGTPAQPAG